MQNTHTNQNTRQSQTCCIIINFPAVFDSPTNSKIIFIFLSLPLSFIISYIKHSIIIFHAPALKITIIHQISHHMFVRPSAFVSHSSIIPPIILSFLPNLSLIFTIHFSNRHTTIINRCPIFDVPPYHSSHKLNIAA